MMATILAAIGSSIGLNISKNEADWKAKMEAKWSSELTTDFRFDVLPESSGLNGKGSVFVSMNGTYLVVDDSDDIGNLFGGGVGIWNLRNHKLIYKNKKRGEVVFSPSGQTLFYIIKGHMGSDIIGKVEINLETGVVEEIKRFDRSSNYYSDKENNVISSQWSRFLLARALQYNGDEIGVSPDGRFHYGRRSYEYQYYSAGGMTWLKEGSELVVVTKAEVKIGKHLNLLNAVSYEREME